MVEQRNLIDRVRENLRFIVGQQWDPADLQILIDEGKPHLTYNEILSKCNALVGEFLSNMQQVQVYPRRGGVKTIANVFTHLAKHAMDLCDGDYEEAACFMEGLAGISNLAWDINYDDDPFNGDIQVRKVSAFRMVWDHNAREYDPNKSGRHVTEIWYWNQDEIEKTYPGKYDAEGVSQPSGEGSEDTAFDESSAALDDTYQEAKSATGVIKNLNQKKQQIRCTWWTDVKKLQYLHDIGNPQTGPNLIRLVNKKQLQIAQIMIQQNPQRFKIIDRLGKVLNKTVWTGQIVLEHKENPLGPITNFPMMRFCPYWIDGYILGIIDNAQDPQRELNKRMSQTLRLLNEAANSKYYAQENEKKTIEALQAGDEIIPYQKEKPDQQKPPTIPQGHFMLAQANSEAIGRVMGVREPQEGASESKDQSGIALLRLQQAGTKMARPVLNNFRMTRKIVYQGIVDIIRHSDVYSFEEIEQIVPADQLYSPEMVHQAGEKVGPPPQPPRQPNPAVMQFAQEKAATDPKYKNMLLASQIKLQQAMQQYQVQVEQYKEKVKQQVKADLLEQLKSWSMGRYGTKTSQQPLSETLKLAYAQMLLDLRQSGIKIPDDIIIESLDHPAGEKIIERMRQQQAAAPAGAA